VCAYGRILQRKDATGGGGGDGCAPADGTTLVISVYGSLDTSICGGVVIEENSNKFLGIVVHDPNYGAKSQRRVVLPAALRDLYADQDSNAEAEAFVMDS